MSWTGKLWKLSCQKSITLKHSSRKKLHIVFSTLIRTLIVIEVNRLVTSWIHKHFLIRMCLLCLFPAWWQIVNCLLGTCYKLLKSMFSFLTSCSNNFLLSCNSTTCNKLWVPALYHNSGKWQYWILIQLSTSLNIVTIVNKLLVEGQLQEMPDICQTMVWECSAMLAVDGAVKCFASLMHWFPSNILAVCAILL